MIIRSALRLPLAAAIIALGAALSPAAAQAPEHAPPPATAAPGDAFGEEIVLVGKPIVYLEGSLRTTLSADVLTARPSALKRVAENQAVTQRLTEST